jgi:hypothetical protein
MKTALRLVLAVAWWSDCQAGDLANGVCGKPTDPCRTVQNVAACVALAAANCTTILVMESCPVQFACGDSTTPPPPSVCGSPTDPCMNQQSYMQCIALENGGCKDITARKSCPLQFACNDKPGISSVCGKPSDSCMNQKNWAKCKRLEKQCDVEMMETCPLQFACKQVPVPSVCGTPSDNCMTGALWRQCRKLEKAGCQRIVAGQSCPYSGFQCADPPDSCATFEVFESRRCQRGAAPPKTISIPVWSKPFDTCSTFNLGCDALLP